MDSKGLKERITSGLIVWLLVTIFIQPILSITWKAIVWVGGFVHQGYVDRIYIRAAIDTNPYGETTLVILVLTVLLISLHWTVNSLESDVRSEHMYRSVRLAKVITLLLTLICILLGFVRLAIVRGTGEIAESFTQRLTVLAPAISDTEYKTLRARWAGMRGKADYDALVAAMDKRAAELGVTLPIVRKP